jgi:hypothetical protein
MERMLHKILNILFQILLLVPFCTSYCLLGIIELFEK